jgi:hypothetical protein
VWDTKGNRGREEFKLRLTNSLRVGVPFNNLVIENGVARRLPTIWLASDCRHVIEGMKNWRMEDYASREMLSKNDPKEKPQQKWSHFCIGVESMLKIPQITMARWGTGSTQPQRPRHYMTGRG